VENIWFKDSTVGSSDKDFHTRSRQHRHPPPIANR